MTEEEPFYLISALAYRRDDSVHPKPPFNITGMFCTPQPLSERVA